MQKIGETLIVSPSDLVGYLACEHLSSLEMEAVRGLRVRPVREDPEIDVLTRRGMEHERAHLDRLKSKGLQIAAIPDPDSTIDPLEALRNRADETLQAMRSGVDVIYQATFLEMQGTVAWRGHADFLERVSVPSRLGNFSYEPVDTKLARSVKPPAVLQLCRYAEHIERLQGAAPVKLHVVLGRGGRVSIPSSAVSAYYRAAKNRFLTALENSRETYPRPVPHCVYCRWLEVCEGRWEEDDHLCRVAGLNREQARRLESAGVTTLRGLAESESGLSVPGISAGVLNRLREQAKLQFAGASEATPPVELLLPMTADRGLATLPEPSAGDLFYDIEGDPHVGPDGLEYLHGVGWGENGTFRFQAYWAHNSAEERRAFEQVIDFIVSQRSEHPGMHVYHYAPYERTALGKLMGRYGTREEELDDLLRGDVFVDLYRVVRQGLIVGVRSYSIKELEPLYMETRSGKIKDAGSSVVEYERWLQSADDAILNDIEKYNRDDVESTWRLRAWLEGKRQEAIQVGHPAPRPAPREPEAKREDSPKAERERLASHLLAESIEPPSPEDTDEDRARWVMGHLLFWHQREDKPEWWRYFERILHSDEADLLADTEAIAGLELSGDPVPEKSSLIWTYRFDPDQEFKLNVGDRPEDPEVERKKYLEGVAPNRPGEIVELDYENGLVRLKRGTRSTAPHPRFLIPSRPINTDQQRAALGEVARVFMERGLKSPNSQPARFEAARRLLANLPPKIQGIEPGQPLRRSGEDVVEAAIRLAQGLERSVLPIQGPPGSGKTYTAARVIAALVRDGRKVGITANSHAVITNLLNATLEAADESGVSIRAIQKVSSSQAFSTDGRVIKTTNNPDVDSALRGDSVNVVAGTSWLFSRTELSEALDFLVVDEAGQLALANVIAVATAAMNLILVGDPQQLSQPSKGTHPPAAGVSGLEHVLKGEATIADDRGLFLDSTRRMHPGICAFVSEQVYDGRLQSRAECGRQRIHSGPVTEGAGLRWLAVEHEGNRTSSDEESEATADVFTALLGRLWTNEKNEQEEIRAKDILVVAPYNAQVNRIRERLPRGARVGTVDKFQGQEAPVVLVSLAASSAADVPRGMEFLYSRNRLNVAVSRARAMTVLICSPALLSAQCRNLEQMRLANILCRLVEMAERITLQNS